MQTESMMLKLIEDLGEELGTPRTGILGSVSMGVPIQMPLVATSPLATCSMTAAQACTDDTYIHPQVPRSLSCVCVYIYCIITEPILTRDLGE